MLTGKAGVSVGDAGAWKGVTGVVCTQAAAKTTLVFTRPFNNKTPNYQQIASVGPTITQYAVGDFAKFVDQDKLPTVMSAWQCCVSSSFSLFSP